MIKMDVIEFVEQILEMELAPYQKEFINQVYDAAKNHQCIMYIPPRGNTRFSLACFQSLVLLYIAKEEGLIKEIK